MRFIISFVLGSLVFPLAAAAAFEPLTPTDLFPAGFEIGDRVRTAASSTVYYLGANGSRYVFPNDETYFTWYADFSGVKTIAVTNLSTIPLAGNATNRPGVRMVKIQTNPTVYAVTRGGILRSVPDEPTAAALYGLNWNRQIDDVPDVFWVDYTLGAGIVSAGDYVPETARDETPTINIDKQLEVRSVYRSLTLSLSQGSFPVRVIELARSQFDMVTDTGALADCDRDCPAKSLAEYVIENSGAIGIHGTYFCPPDYSQCADEVNSFLWPVYNSAADVMVNEDALRHHEGPLIAVADDAYFYFHRARDFGDSVADFESRTGVALTAAIAHHPSLVEDGTVVVYGEPRLDDAMKTIKAVRGGIGYNDQYVMLVVASQATVPDLAYIFEKLGATFAMNLDGGGSAALYEGGAYRFGPGRLLPNTIIFKSK